MARRVLLLVFISASLVLLGFGIAQKQPPPPSPEEKARILDENVKQMLDLMDTDKNGKISRQEWMSFWLAEFDRLDTDKSGELDRKELLKSRTSIRAFRFADQGK